jgi:hypothetical protein
MRPQLYMEPNLPNDAELERLTNYVGGFMSDAEMAAFDEQLASDEDFYHRMAPMLKAWYTRTPAPSIMQAGVRIKEREVEQKRHAVSRRRVRFVSFGGLAAAASTVFAMMQTGVMQFAFGPRVPAQSVAVQAPPTPTHAPAVFVAAGSSKTPAPTIRHVVTASVNHDTVVRVIELPAFTALPEARLTPTTVVAQIDRVILRGYDLTPPPRNLGNDTKYVPPQANGSAPGSNATKGKGFDFPWIDWSWPWNWSVFHRR